MNLLALLAQLRPGESQIIADPPDNIISVARDLDCYIRRMPTGAIRVVKRPREGNDRHRFADIKVGEGITVPGATLMSYAYHKARSVAKLMGYNLEYKTDGNGLHITRLPDGIAYKGHKGRLLSMAIYETFETDKGINSVIIQTVKALMKTDPVLFRVDHRRGENIHTITRLDSLDPACLRDAQRLRNGPRPALRDESTNMLPGKRVRTRQPLLHDFLTGGSEVAGFPVKLIETHDNGDITVEVV